MVEPKFGSVDISSGRLWVAKMQQLACPFSPYDRIERFAPKALCTVDHYLGNALEILTMLSN